MSHSGRARPYPPLEGRGIAYGFAASIALFGKMDSENDFHEAEGVVWASSRRRFGDWQTLVRGTHDTIFGGSAEIQRETIAKMLLRI